MNILLACNAGVSTGMLAKKMEEYALTQGVEARVWAVDFSQVEAEVSESQVDCVLIGPQIAYKLKGLQSDLAPKGIPVGSIAFTDYGTMNAANVFNTAAQLVKE